ncbi:MAG TPA: TolC family protein, partial [Phenylobacterium sp.]|nr:TolC family protein [Phenylobacterium sp.]
MASIFSAGLIGLPQAAAAESLLDALALAYQTNPVLQAQRANLRALDESIVQARSGWRPTLGVSASATYNEVRTPNGGGIDESNSATAGLSLTQPLWTGGRVASAVSAAEAEVLAGRESLRRVEAEVLAGVITAYVDVRRDQEALRIRRDNVQVLSRQLDESNARFEVGEITRTDVAIAESRLAAARAQLAQAEGELAIARESFVLAVG